MKKTEFREKIEKIDRELFDLYNLTFDRKVEDVRATVQRNINGAIEGMIYQIDKIKEYLNEKPMPEDVEQYFFEKYEKANFRIVPGHHPSFQNKKDVDDWFNFMKKLGEVE